MSLYDQFICGNDDDKCYYVKPFPKTGFNGTNPNTGKPFTQEEIKIISQHFYNTCSTKNGTVNYCCDPFDSKTNDISNEMKTKYPNIKVNRVNNSINTIEVCNNPDSSKCEGTDWQTPKPYHVCKMEGGSRIKGDKNIDTIVNLQKDCYSIHCTPQEPEISLANFIGEVTDKPDYSYYDHINLVEAIKNDSVQALIQEYLPKVDNNVDIILTHNERGETMLHEAVRNGSSKVTAFLVGRGADLNAQNIMGDTPLHLGARYDKTNIVYALLNYGATINIENNRGEVPINEAVKDASIDMLRILAHNGGNIYQINKDGDNLLHIAIQYAIKDKALKVKYLVERGVSITHKNNKGHNPINTTEEMLEEMKQDKNSDIILENFSCLTGFKKYERYYNNDIPEILTYLQKISYKQNKNQYQDYIIGELPDSSYVEFNYGVCVGGNRQGEPDTKESCNNAGGEWINEEHSANEHTTKVKVDYHPDSEILLDQLKNEELYKAKCNKPIPVKLLPHMTGEIDLGLNNEINNINNNTNHNTIKNNNNKNNNINNINNINNNTNHKNNNNNINNINNNINNNNTNIVEGFESGFSVSYCNIAMVSLLCFIVLATTQMKSKK